MDGKQQLAGQSAERRPDVRQKFLIVIMCVIAVGLLASTGLLVRVLAISDVTASTREGDAATATGLVCSTSFEQWVDIPGLSETFSFGGTQPRRVIVMFTAGFGGTGDDNYLNVRLRIDGDVQPPGAVTVNYPGSFARTGGFNFVSDRLEPGSHTAKLQYRITVGDGSPGQGCLHTRSMVILHD